MNSITLVNTPPSTPSSKFETPPSEKQTKKCPSPPSKIRNYSTTTSDSSTNRKSYFNNTFLVIKTLGSGDYGDVFHVKNNKNGREYAIKKSKHAWYSNSQKYIL